MNIAQAEIKIGKEKASCTNDKVQLAYIVNDNMKHWSAKPALGTDVPPTSKGSRLTEKGSKSQTGQGSMGQGSKAESRCGSGENALRQVMFSFFYQPKLLRLPAWGNLYQLRHER